MTNWPLSNRRLGLLVAVKLKSVSVQCLTDRTASLVNAVIPPTHFGLLTSLGYPFGTDDRKVSDFLTNLKRKLGLSAGAKPRGQDAGVYSTAETS
jgi:hypothetical protein